MGAGVGPSLVQMCAGVSPFLVQMGGGMSPFLARMGAGVGPFLVQMGAGVGPFLVQMGAGVGPFWMQMGAGAEPSLRCGCGCGCEHGMEPNYCLSFRAVSSSWRRGPTPRWKSAATRHTWSYLRARHVAHVRYAGSKYGLIPPHVCNWLTPALVQAAGRVRRGGTLSTHRGTLSTHRVL